MDDLQPDNRPNPLEYERVKQRARRLPIVIIIVFAVLIAIVAFYFLASRSAPQIQLTH